MKKLSWILLIAGIAFSFTNAKASENDAAENKNLITTSVKGHVLDKVTGEALTGVTIKVNNNTFYSDFEGNFEINNLKPGEYDLSVSYISYRNINQKVKVEAMSDNTMSLEIESLAISK